MLFTSIYDCICFDARRTLKTVSLYGSFEKMPYVRLYILDGSVRLLRMCACVVAVFFGCILRLCMRCSVYRSFFPSETSEIRCVILEFAVQYLWRSRRLLDFWSTTFNGRKYDFLFDAANCISYRHWMLLWWTIFDFFFFAKRKQFGFSLMERHFMTLNMKYWGKQTI